MTLPHWKLWTDATWSLPHPPPSTSSLAAEATRASAYDAVTETSTLDMATPAPALSDTVAIKCAANSDDAVATLSSPVAKRECVAYADDNTVVSTMQQKMDAS